MKNLYSWICSLALISLACQASAAQAAPMKEAATERPPTATPTMPAQVRAREVCAESLHVRVAPMGEVRGWAGKGEVLEVLPAVDGWSQIAAGKWRGLWVRESWLCRK